MLFGIARVSTTALWMISALSLSACQGHSLSALRASAPAPGVPSVVSSAASSSEVASSTPSSVTAGAPSTSSSSADSCPSSADLPGQRPETYTGTNNSPFSSRTDPEPTACEIARENDHKWTRLVGYTIDEATKRAKAAGWEGKVEVRQLREYDAKCKEGLVCTFEPARWEIGQGSTLTLYRNHKVEISTPD
jgi:hypothetical protein